MNAKTELAAWCIENNQELVLNEHSERFKYLEANSGPIVGESMQNGRLLTNLVSQRQYARMFDGAVKR